MKKAGLCINCANSDDCMYNNGQSVLQCEEFSIKKEAPTYHQQSVEKSEIMEPCRIQGICSNCIYRMDCSIRDPEYIIWRCEEYA